MARLSRRKKKKKKKKWKKKQDLGFRLVSYELAEVGGNELNHWLKAAEGSELRTWLRLDSGGSSAHCFAHGPFVASLPQCEILADLTTISPISSFAHGPFAARISDSLQSALVSLLSLCLSDSILTSLYYFLSHLTTQVSVKS